MYFFHTPKLLSWAPFFQKLAQQAAHGCKTGVFGTALGRSAPKSEIKVMVKPPGGPHEKRLPPRPLKRPAMLVRICRACKKMHLGVQFLSGLFGPRRANWRAGINHLMAHPDGNPPLAKTGQSPGRQYFFCSVHRLRQPLPGATDSDLCHFYAQLPAQCFFFHTTLLCDSHTPLKATCGQRCVTSHTPQHVAAFTHALW